MKNAQEARLVIEGQHNAIRAKLWDSETGLCNSHPGAQWFSGAGLGLFLHWGISAVSGAFDLSWAMITGWELARRDLTPEEVADYNRRRSYTDGGAEITPNEYFRLAKDFGAEHYDADEWMRLAKEAGFTYAVLTTRHHDGFALWPSDYGDFSTKNYLGGRDLVGEYVNACRKYGLRVGLYYSPPDWHFNRDYMSYLIYTAKQRNPGLYDLDCDYGPWQPPDEERMHKQHLRHAEYVNGQLEELLTQYGKIDLLWFDGSMPDGLIYPMEKIRALQPGIVVNHRLHGAGDFETCEVKEAEQRPKGWWEFCTQWPEKGWAYMKDVAYRPLAAISAEFTRTLAWGGNYLLDIGPMADGRFPPQAREALAEFTVWRNQNAEGLAGVTPLPEGEACSEPTAAKGKLRYCYAPPEGKGEIVFKLEQQVLRMTLLDDGSPIRFRREAGTVYVSRPAALPSGAVRVIRAELGAD